MKTDGGKTAIDPALFADDPNWVSCVPEMASGGKKCGMPAHDDCSPLDVDSAAANLKPGGILGASDGYEERPGQIDMLKAIARAFNDRSHLMIEAGTGVGKSLAYLVPAVNWAVLNDTPVVVSTATRNLQSQLISSDIPRAVKTVPGNVRVALLKGRGNYLCLYALSELMRDGYYSMNGVEREEFGNVVRWLHSDGCDGDLDTVNVPELRSRLVCAGEDCGGKRCQYASRCFIRKARERALRAHLVVANHALVLAEAANPGSGILPAYGRLVFDEAHNLEDIATGFFSHEFSKITFAQLIGRITRKVRGRKERGLIGTIEKQLKRGSLSSAPNAAKIGKAAQTVRTACTFARLEADAVMDVAAHLLSPAEGEQTIRYRRLRMGENAYAPRQYSRNGLFRDYVAAQWDESALDGALVKFEAQLAKVANALTALAHSIDDATSEDELDLFGDLSALAMQTAAEVRSYLATAKSALSGDDPQRVYWVERGAADADRTGHPPSIRFVAAPLSIAKEMRRCFYDVKDSVVLCSATLRVGDRFDYMAKRLGCAPENAAAPEECRVRRLVAASPFDYFRQALVLAPDFLPDPAADGQAYAEALAPFLRKLFEATEGRGLVLFTSYDMMRTVAERARPMFSMSGIDLCVQGDGLSRELMAAKLKAGGRTVLFGAQSFWEGVDVAGDALSCVVIARLPFPQVREPVTEARCEQIEDAGGRAFHDYMVPEAVIKFRQGFGRLIRTKRDRGVVVVTDRRIVTKNYGAIFRKSIAASAHTVRSEEELMERVRMSLTALSHLSCRNGI